MDPDLVTVLIGPPNASKLVPQALVMRRAIFDTIDRAKRELIVVGFMITDEQIVERIASKGGTLFIDVHVDKKQTEDWQVAVDAADRLRRSGAVVHMHDEGMRESLHAKVIIADGAEAIVGSANLTSRGADRNYEVGVRIRGPSVKILRKAIRTTLGGGNG